MNASELDAYDFALDPAQIAQHPPTERDGGRLLVLERSAQRWHHARVSDLPGWLAAGDLLVRNRSRVLSARLHGRKASGGAAEALLLGPNPEGDGRFDALLRSRGRAQIGAKYVFEGAAGFCDAEIAALGESGRVVLAFPADVDPYAFGSMPLPPYIRKGRSQPLDRERYQTLYAREAGSIAAPTAGLHFSEALLTALETRGVESAELVLHVGLGTFLPLREAALSSGRLHAETYVVPPECAHAVAATRARGRRVVAVGTTSARVLESCSDESGRPSAGAGSTQLFLQPGARFRAVDALFTNLHLPRSSLLLLVCAFAGRDLTLAAYAEAARCGYRFYSYGDAMLIL